MSKQTPKQIVIANWKMQPLKAATAEALFLDIKEYAARCRNVIPVIAPPFVYLTNLTDLYGGKHIRFGAQDVFWESRGSYTGEISSAQLSDLGVSYAIVGHSERRALGETDEQVSAKAAVAITHGMTAVVCVGEHSRDSHGAYLDTLRAQITNSIERISAGQYKRLVVAYEPLWAIGRSAAEAITPHELHETALFIRKVLAERYGTTRGCAVPILYGGSVEAKNCEKLGAVDAVDGFLVGHASLHARSFGEILQTLN